ncbi:UPF0179 family protein [Candidatus Bathyarchaeota archaeon]|nr:UPF0179 family protein [Candidatus Bathyarchaeota archaeon]
MSRTKPIITLLGIGETKINEVFVHKGPGSKCPQCKYFNVCVKNLEEGRAYIVVGVRDKTLRCEMYNLEMRVVEVVEADIQASVVSRQAIEGAIITFRPQNCSEHGCENFMLCSPEYLMENDRCEVVRVYEMLRCPRGLQLRRVMLRRAPPS